MSTVDQFLGEISRLVRESDGPQLQAYLVIEPPYGDLYQVMIRELRQSFSKGNDEALETKCSSLIPEAQGGGEVASWTAFTKFMVQYLVFIRDVDIQNLLDTYNLLNELVQYGFPVTEGGNGSRAYFTLERSTALLVTLR